MSLEKPGRSFRYDIKMNPRHLSFYTVNQIIWFSIDSTGGFLSILQLSIGCNEINIYV
jgi:hypothetical protein